MPAAGQFGEMIPPDLLTTVSWHAKQSFCAVCGSARDTGVRPVRVGSVAP